MMKGILIGVSIIPALWVLAQIAHVVLPAMRDTIKRLRMGLRPGYSRWRYLYLAPMLFWDMLKQQTWSWWNGIRTTVDWE